MHSCSLVNVFSLIASFGCKSEIRKRRTRNRLFLETKSFFISSDLRETERNTIYVARDTKLTQQATNLTKTKEINKLEQINY